MISTLKKAIENDWISSRKVYIDVERDNGIVEHLKIDYYKHGHLDNDKTVLVYFETGDVYHVELDKDVNVI